MDEKVSCKTKKVLIVEDEKPARLALFKKLSMYGFNIIEAQNGKEGLDQIRKERPDLVLADVKMPIMSGIEMLDAMNKDETLRGTQAIVLTNDSTAETLASVLSVGGAHYFIKADTPIEVIVDRARQMLNCE